MSGEFTKYRTQIGDWVDTFRSYAYLLTKARPPESETAASYLDLIRPQLEETSRRYGYIPRLSLQIQRSVFQNRVEPIEQEWMLRNFTLGSKTETHYALYDPEAHKTVDLTVAVLNSPKKHTVTFSATPGDTRAFIYERRGPLDLYMNDAAYKAQAVQIAALNLTSLLKDAEAWTPESASSGRGVLRAVPKLPKQPSRLTIVRRADPPTGRL